MILTIITWILFVYFLLYYLVAWGSIPKGFEAVPRIKEQLDKRKLYVLVTFLLAAYRTWG